MRNALGTLAAGLLLCSCTTYHVHPGGTAGPDYVVRRIQVGSETLYDCYSYLDRRWQPTCVEVAFREEAPRREQRTGGGGPAAESSASPTPGVRSPAGAANEAYASRTAARPPEALQVEGVVAQGRQLRLSSGTVLVVRPDNVATAAQWTAGDQVKVASGMVMNVTRGEVVYIEK